MLANAIFKKIHLVSLIKGIQTHLGHAERGVKTGGKRSEKAALFKNCI